MVQQVINAIVPVAITALVAVLVAGVKALGDAGVELINRKKEAVVAKIGADTYNQRLAVARQMWGAVDEEFRITPTLEKTIENKQKLFAEKIKKAIPGITDSEIEQLRQAVAGEVNKGKAALTSEALAEKSTAAQALQSAAAAVQAAQKAINGTAQADGGKSAA
jgi:hypothetical protein